MKGVVTEVAEAAAETPKISTGIASGRTRIAGQQAAAPQRHRERRADRRRAASAPACRPAA